MESTTTTSSLDSSLKNQQEQEPNSKDIPPPPPPPQSAQKGDGLDTLKPSSSPPPPPPPLPSSQSPLMTYKEQMAMNPVNEEKKKVDRFQLKNATGLEIYGIDWKTICKVKFSESGESGGVIFAFDTTNQVVVIKGSSTITQEVFAFMLAKILRIQVPKMRVVSWSQMEWGEMKEHLHNVAKQDDDLLTAKIDKALDRPVFMIMEFIPGVEVQGLSQEMAQEYFCEPQNFKILMKTLGKIALYDILINNWDRMQLGLWDNEGNARNLLISKKITEYRDIVGIDQAVTSIQKSVNKVGYDQYLEKVKNFLTDILTNSRGKDSAISIFKSFLESVTLIQIPAETFEYFREGVISCLKEVCHLDKDDLENLLHRVDGLVAVDWENCWENGIKLISLDFLYDIITVCKETYSNLSESNFIQPPQTPLSFTQNYSDVKVSIFQVSGVVLSTLDQFCQNLDQYLLRESKIRKPDFIIFPECVSGLKKSKAVINEENPFLSAVSKIIAKHGVYAICGTIIEQERNKENRELLYVTAILLGPDGNIIGTYRKQRLTVEKGVECGNDLGIFDTIHGKIAILICFDIENDDLLQRTLAQGPRIIFNPSFIFHSPTSSNQKSKFHTRKTGMETMSRKWERLCRERGVNIVRCDQSEESFCLGSSLVVTPSTTIYSPSSEHCVFSVHLDSYDPVDLSWIYFPAPTPARTEWVDNTGIRSKLSLYNYNSLVTSALHLPKSSYLITLTNDGMIHSKNLVTNEMQDLFLSESPKDLIPIDASSLFGVSNSELFFVELFPPEFSKVKFEEEEEIDEIQHVLVLPDSLFVLITKTKMTLYSYSPGSEGIHVKIVNSLKVPFDDNQVITHAISIVNQVIVCSTSTILFLVDFSTETITPLEINGKDQTDSISALTLISTDPSHPHLSILLTTSKNYFYGFMYKNGSLFQIQLKNCLSTSNYSKKLKSSPISQLLLLNGAHFLISRKDSPGFELARCQFSQKGNNLMILPLQYIHLASPISTFHFTPYSLVCSSEDSVILLEFQKNRHPELFLNLLSQEKIEVQK